ncbi:hypothetical protein [Paracidovorax anthurii]|uniref:hypothetical protein n=1 Tax=Paracidovorax anthurii TaxID=78229 RepID=UPI001B863B86|nr:hypothetical protein [Paracidovorax anthurii]
MSGTPNASRDAPGAEAPAPASHPPAVLQAPAGLSGAPQRPDGAAAGPLPRGPLPRPSGEMRSQSSSAEANPPQRPEAARQPSQAKRTTLGELLALERQQEQAERAQKARKALRAQQAELVGSALPKGGKTMRRLKGRAARQHPATLAEKWHARLQEPPKPMEGRRREAFEARVRADLMAIAQAGGIDPVQAVDAMGTALEDGMLGQGILEEDRKLLLNVLDQWAMDRLYERLDLKVTRDTRPAYTNVHVQEKPRKLGSGAFHTVFEVKLAGPDGRAFDGVFKPLKKKEGGWAAAVTGIPGDNPQTAMRNIATVSYARKLGLPVIADTRVALIDTGGGPFASHLGLMMERARGQPAREVDLSVLNRPEVCVEVTKLQLLDHLTGQCDRHGYNYFIHRGPDGSVQVTGIDNDQCFGKSATEPGDIAQIQNDPWRFGLHGTEPPPVVDTGMERAIQTLTERDIRSMLEDKLTEPEIDAAVQRHQGLKDHIAQLRAGGWVIEPEQWGRPDIAQLLTPKNSYIGRERHRAQVKAAKEAAQAAQAAPGPGNAATANPPW